ncbi:MAG: histidinol dehydrogenase [SAR202 cluster bacterium]|nr:histidinol dehydrogenase [SAR202 cluster bacterium]|tara:strand:- start:1700 stop:3016 length:1317 start_codon:yes stop_codon:yes gene_type:complete
MKHITKIKDAITFFENERVISNNNILSDGNGLFPKKYIPSYFVKKIDEIVRKEGDEGLRRISSYIDRNNLVDFEIPKNEIIKSIESLNKDEENAIKNSIERVTDYQKKLLNNTWMNEDQTIGEKVVPMESSLAYVPSGTAPLISTAIMTIVPAKVAGVKNIYVTTPADKNSKVSEKILAASYLSGADRIFKIGGAQAISAFTYGTELIPKVDIICGPGNLWVTAAKKHVYGDVGIDGLYGPTETLVIIDENSDPDYAASDLIAQAEHDVSAMPILISNSETAINNVMKSIKKQVINLERSSIINQSLKNRGVTIFLSTLDEIATITNYIAPEHLCIATKNPEKIYNKITNAGAIFMGEWSAEVMADYIAGPSHVMPTSGTAKFSSSLSVRNFLKYIPVLNFKESTFSKLSLDAEIIANMENLSGHANAAKIRIEKSNG